MSILVVARVSGATVSVRRWRGVILGARENTTSAVGFLRVGPQFNIVWRGVVGKSVVDVGIGVVLVAAPEETTAAAPAVGVVVGRRRTETLLTLVVTGIEHLEQDGNKEEKAAKRLVPYPADQTREGFYRLTFQ